ncbi:hypothetical protein [Candidatus Pelagibacter sp. HIMB1521]|uniref:hypothetical protein n=1 Tax=Candidatus Pelagibacter sp. HIMB1521 TaxID=3413344 RepID=UPI003F8384BC
MHSEIKFYGLLFLKDEFQNLNFDTKKIDKQRLIYLKCAANLSRSLGSLGYKYVLLCNDLDKIQEISIKNNLELNLEKINFETYVPNDIHFSPCHYRVDVFKYFSQKKNEFSILIDLDVLVVSKLPPLKEIFLYGEGYINNISDNIFPAYGKKFINSQLKIINSSASTKWVGGDFFAGNKEFYKLLYKYSKKYQTFQVQNKNKLKNMTDELFLTGAINEISSNDLYKVNDVNNLKIFSRYWSININHKQKDFNYIINNFQLLHLLADKKKISNFYDENLSIDETRIAYVDYIRSLKLIGYNFGSKYLPKFLKKIIKKIISN